MRPCRHTFWRGLFHTHPSRGWSTLVKVFVGSLSSAHNLYIPSTRLQTCMFDETNTIRTVRSINHPVPAGRSTVRTSKYSILHGSSLLLPISVYKCTSDYYLRNLYFSFFKFTGLPTSVRNVVLECSRRHRDVVLAITSHSLSVKRGEDAVAGPSCPYKRVGRYMTQRC